MYHVASQIDPLVCFSVCLCDCVLHTSKLVTGEGNGTPLQYSCLENPRDGGAWWAAVHGVARVGHD